MKRKNVKKGAVGIGTLIIFIAMVLVAAIAAAVLINVSGILQQRSMATGKESIQTVSSNLIVSSIMGTVQGTGQNKNISRLDITITAAAGAGRLDLSKLVVKVGDNNRQQTYVYSGSNIASDPSQSTTVGQFGLVSIRDPSGLFSAANPVIDGSSLVSINLTVATDVDFGVRKKFHIELIPEFGQTVYIDGTTPNTYPTTLAQLYP